MRHQQLHAALVCLIAATATGSWMGSAFAQAPRDQTIESQTPIAPALPVPPVDENASAEEWLHAARSAIARGRTGEAQEAMERAQTRLLDRSVALFKTDRPSTHPAIPLISQASQALAAGDRAAAMQYLAQALPLAHPAKE